MSATIELEFEDLDAQCRWQPLYLEIRNESHDYPHRVAKFPENRNRNRYRDVSPYDHSRVKLQNTENDYINASLVDIEEAQRSYILTQGPLPNTCCHFWLMVWQQKTKAVVMLNQIVEKESPFVLWTVLLLLSCRTYILHIIQIQRENTIFVSLRLS
uniref:protein-tyrosine-phosphatase n=1 Tax=Nannospalax galili TaxID=1026970 RepID=A0A8C6QXP7_NANGA